MTPGEQRVLTLLAAAHNEFTNLETAHPADSDDFTYGMHVLQNLIMARETYRNNPKFFHPGGLKRE